MQPTSCCWYSVEPKELGALRIDLDNWLIEDKYFYSKAIWNGLPLKADFTSNLISNSLRKTFLWEKQDEVVKIFDIDYPTQIWDELPLKANFTENRFYVTCEISVELAERIGKLAECTVVEHDYSLLTMFIQRPESHMVEVHWSHTQHICDFWVKHEE